MMTIAINTTQPIDHYARLASAEARMRNADTVKALERAIDAVDLACAGILTFPARTGADYALRARAQEWVRTRTRQVINAHEALASRDLYRVRRVAADRPYARKEAQRGAA